MNKKINELYKRLFRLESQYESLDDAEEVYELELEIQSLLEDIADLEEEGSAYDDSSRGT